MGEVSGTAGGSARQGSVSQPCLIYNVFLLDVQGLKPKVVDSSNNLVMLPELEAWTWYCVMIQSRYDYYNKTSVYTEPQCMQTEGRNEHFTLKTWRLVSELLDKLPTCILCVCRDARERVLQDHLHNKSTKV